MHNIWFIRELQESIGGKDIHGKLSATSTSIAVFGVIAILAGKSSWAVEVTTYAELSAAIGSAEPLIELGAEQFVLEGTLTISHDCTIRCAPSVENVTIDQNGYRIIFRNAECSVGDVTRDARISFVNGNDNVTIYATTAPTHDTFYHCSFNYSRLANGLALRVGAQPLTVMCFDCEASYNFGDGYNIHNIIATPGLVTLTLVDCCARFNAPLRNGGPNGDGVTAHAPNHKIYIHGGDYHDNGKGGVTMVGGSCLVVDGEATFHGNGTVVNLHDVYMADKGVVTWLGGSVDTMWVRASTLDLAGGRINDSIIGDLGASINIYGFGFKSDGSVYMGYFSDWEPFRVLAANTETMQSIYEYEVPIPGDFDESGMIDSLDAAVLLSLISGPDGVVTPKTNTFDFDGDNDIDLGDMAMFQRIFGLP